MYTKQILAHLQDAWDEKESDHPDLLSHIRSEVGYVEDQTTTVSMCDHWLRGLGMGIEFYHWDIAQNVIGVDADSFSHDQLYDMSEEYWKEAARICATECITKSEGLVQH